MHAVSGQHSSKNLQQIYSSWKNIKYKLTLTLFGINIQMLSHYSI